MQFDYRNGNNGNVKFIDCRNIRIDGPVFRDSSLYSAGFYRCEKVEIDGLKTIGMWRYNCDGVDI